MEMQKMKWTAALLISILLLTINIFLLDRKESDAVEAPRLETALSKEKELVRTWEASGIARSKDTVHMYADPSLGVVKEIHVRPGDQVSPGQTVVTYQNHDLENTLRSLTKAKEAADVRSEIYTSQIVDWESELSVLDEDEDGVDAYILLKEQLANAELQAGLAERESAVLFDEIVEIEKKLDALSIKSPVEGVVTLASQYAKENPLITIVGKENFVIEASIDEKMAVGLKTGDRVKVKASGIEQDQEGTVQAVLPSSDPNRFILTVVTENDSLWTEGQRARIILSQTVSEGAVSVPSQAVFEVSGEEFVFVILKDKLQKKKVKSGIKQGGHIVIEQGLKKNEAVVLKPSPVFVSGRPAIDLNKK
jgi:HlyD family secretion protein